MLELLPQSITDYLFVNSDHRERALDILECRLKGSATRKELAQKHGISKERVRQHEMRGRRLIAQHLKKREEAWKKQGELLAIIKRLEAGMTVGGDKPVAPIIYINDLDTLDMISRRLYWALRCGGIKTLNEAAALLAKGEGELLKLKNFGRVSLTELKGLLDKYGLTAAAPSRAGFLNLGK